MMDLLSLALSANEYGRIAFSEIKDPEPLEMAIRGLHLTAPQESTEYRTWLREYVRTGWHPLDLLTYRLRKTSWEEQLACRDSLVVAIRMGHLTPKQLAVLNRFATLYDRQIFRAAADALVDWHWGSDDAHPVHHMRQLLRMVDGYPEDLP